MVPWQMMQKKSSLSNFCLTKVRNLNVFLEVHSREKAFAKSDQCYHLTSTDAETVAIRLLLPFIGRDIHHSHTPLYAYM